MSLSSESKRSFNRFLTIIILIMIFTGFIALWDNWGDDVVEETGLNETKRVALPDDVKIMLQPQSLLRFQKGAAHKILIQGSADVEIGPGKVSREISIETLDLTAKTKKGQFNVATGMEGTSIEVITGRIQVILKPLSAGGLFLDEGEQYQYKREKDL